MVNYAHHRITTGQNKPEIRRLPRPRGNTGPAPDKGIDWLINEIAL